MLSSIFFSCRFLQIVDKWVDFAARAALPGGANAMLATSKGFLHRHPRSAAFFRQSDTANRRTAPNRVRQGRPRHTWASSLSARRSSMSRFRAAGPLHTDRVDFSNSSGGVPIGEFQRTVAHRLRAGDPVLEVAPAAFCCLLPSPTFSTFRNNPVFSNATGTWGELRLAAARIFHQVNWNPPPR